MCVFGLVWLECVCGCGSSVWFVCGVWVVWCGGGGVCVFGFCSWLVCVVAVFFPHDFVRFFFQKDGSFSKFSKVSQHF